MLSSEGVSVGGRKIALDDAKSDVCFVSHAHSDHTSAFSKKRRIIASEETFRIMGREPDILSMPGIELHPAGHMLGARQIAIETDGGRFAYTGDFSLHDSYTSEAGKILGCDTLMIDSTYCLPHLRMPNRRGVIDAMRKFVNENERASIVFGAYVRGKSQELVKFLNSECAIAPVVCQSAAKVCSVYEKCGVRLDYVPLGTDEAEEAMRSRFVAIMPSGMVNFSFGAKLSEAFGRDVKTAVATGWAAVTRFPVDAAFPLSDHADFRDTMRYIYDSGAKTVVCANSGSQNAAAYLRSIGINAASKSDAAKGIQTTLSQCAEAE